MFNTVPLAERAVTADQLEGLPAPIRRYLDYTGIVGQPWVHTVQVRYSGRFRLGLDKPWMPMTAAQVYTTDPPGFHWKAHFRVAGLPLLTGDDTYQFGHGHMYGRLAGVKTIFDARGPELDQGTMLRYLNEMMWFPAAFLQPYITWTLVDDHAADVHFTDAGKTVSARLFIDDDGRLLNFSAQRYREDRGGYTLSTWDTPTVAFGTLAGLRLPLEGTGVWRLPAGDLPYIHLHIDEISYNLPPDDLLSTQQPAG